MKPDVNIMWFRRDLRLHDNAALYHALKSEYPVVPVFIFDKNILDDLEEKKDRRVEFIGEALVEMQTTLKKYKSSLEVFMISLRMFTKNCLKNIRSIPFMPMKIMSSMLLTGTMK